MTDIDITELAARVAALEDRVAIGDLIDRFSRDLDDRTLAGTPFDVAWVRAYFTEDAHVEYPVGSADGAEGVARLIDGTGMAPFQRTQHVTTNYVIDPGPGDGGRSDRAAVRFNLVATHVHRGEPGDRFTVGDYYEGDVVRTASGWRFRTQRLHVTWVDGRPPGAA